MSDQDQLKPYHAKDRSTGQETADVVADVLKHAAERDEAAKKKTGPKPQPKWMLPLAMNMGLLAVYFLVAQPQWTRVNPIQPPPPVEQASQVRNSFVLWIGRIETFAEQNGRLPATLEEARVSGAVGVDYTVRGSSYTLITTVGDEVITYDSATMTTADLLGGPMALGG